jgi:hypothetical protein
MPPARVARGVDRAVVQRALCAFVRARASGARDDVAARASSLLFDAAPPPPTTWGESATRLARVVRLSWSEALARLNIWRLDHVLALRMLSQRDMGGAIAREVARRGTRARLNGTARTADDSNAKEAWEKSLREIKMALTYSKSLRRAPDLKTVAAQGGVGQEAILLSDLAPRMMRPAYVLFRDEDEKRLVFVIRGTHSAKDMITNLTGSVCAHHTMVSTSDDEEATLRVGYAHSGFLTTARFLERKIKDDLLSSLAAHPGYELKIVGHSLGGGVAVLLTEMLRQDPRFKRVGLHCFTFACPSTLSRELAESCRSFVTTCVNNADLVPMVSFSKVSELQREVVSTALEQRLLDKWRESTAAMECARGPTPSRFAAAAAALGKQNYGPQKYPQWLRALKGLKTRHDKLVESSSLYRQSLLIGKRVSNTSSKLASLSGAFIAGIVSPRPRKKKTLERAEPTGESKTEFSKTNQQVGDTISATVLATDICHDAHLAHAHAAAASPKSQEERDFQEYIESARIALDEDFQKPLTADDMKKIYRAEANAAQEVLAMQEDISVMKAAELLGDEEALMTADYYGADLPPPRMDDTASCDDSEREPVVKRVKSASSDARADQDIAKRGTVLLYPAGRILHFVYKSGLDEAVDEARRESRHALFFDVDLDVYRKIILSRTMIADHFLSQYEDVLDSFVRECARA